MGLGFLGVGALYEDTLLSLPWYPEEDDKLRATACATRVGGNIPNTLDVLSQVFNPHDRLVFVSTYAKKAASKRLTDTLADKWVEVAGIWRNCSENPQSWILQSEKSGSRTIVNYNNVEEFTSDELVQTIESLESLEGITWVHFEGRIPDVLFTAIPAICALLPHALISIEFEKPNRTGLMDLLPFADIIFFSHSYYTHYQLEHEQDDPSEFFASMRQENPHAAFIVTAGAEGAFYSVPEEEGHVPTSPVHELVDSTGAGDTFIAGFVWAMGKLEKSVKESVEIGVNIATRKVAQEGFDGVWSLL